MLFFRSEMTDIKRKRIFCIDYDPPKEHEQTVKRMMCYATIINNEGKEQKIWVPGSEDTGKPIQKAYQTKVDVHRAKEIIAERNRRKASKGTRGPRKSAKSSAKHSAAHTPAVTDDEGPPVPMDDGPAAPVTVQRKRTALFPNHQKKAGPKKPKRITKGSYV